MKQKILTFAFFLGAILVLTTQIAVAQKACDGKQLFSEKSCAGDAVDEKEKELFRIINEYRAQNKLAPLVLSDALSVVANRRMIDLTVNINPQLPLSHSWSNCPYDVKNKSTWKCVLDAPKTFGVKYDGNGYENIFRSTKPASPVMALDAWKKSELHNALILNQSFFKDLNWDGIGIAISGNCAAIWVGAKVALAVNSAQSKGLGITFESAVAGLTNVIPIRQTDTVAESNKWSGSSVDKTITLEIYGRREDIAEATIGLSIKLGKDSTMSQRNRDLLIKFLKNLIPEWSEPEKWSREALENLIMDRKVVQSAPIGARFVEMSLDQNSILSVRVKPNSKNSVKQF